MTTTTTTTPAVNLAQYDVILINSSGGKDSQAQLDLLVEQADAQGVSRARLVVVHADLGRVEWQGTKALAAEQARHYGLRFEVVRRQQDLLDQVEARGLWPSSKARFCTSDHKRDQVAKLLTQLTAELTNPGGRAFGRQARILNCQGIRAQESTERAKKSPFQVDKRASNSRRHVDLYYPIFDWSTEQVWARIKASGVRHHRAYDLGASRLSCVFCVFASKRDLTIAAEHNPELLQAYADVEARIGHTFRQDLKIGSFLKLTPVCAA